MDADKRQHARIDTSLETIYYTEHGDDAERLHYFGTITNMSNGGVGMVVNCPHEINEELWLEGIEKATAPLAGLVRWVSNHQDKYAIGIQFRSIAS